MECKLKSVYALGDVIEKGLSIPFADADKPENIPIDSWGQHWGLRKDSF